MLRPAKKNPPTVERFVLTMAYREEQNTKLSRKHWVISESGPKSDTMTMSYCGIIYITD